MRLSEAALDDLRARNPVGPVAERLGATLRRMGRGFCGACPICGGGRTASRFEVRPDGLAWVCAVCQDGGDVIRLVERAQGLDFRGAVAWLGGTADVDPAEAARHAAARAAQEARRAAEADRYREAERQRLYRLWTSAKPIGRTPAMGYLRGRGIDRADLPLRALAKVPYCHGTDAVTRDGRTWHAPRRIHVGPAMLAAIRRPDGKFSGLHLTWLDPAYDGRKATVTDPETGEVLSAKKMRGSTKAGRIALVTPRDARVLVLGEGIETVLSAAVAAGAAAAEALYWAAGSLGNLGGPHLATVAHPTDRLGNGHARRVPGPEPDRAAPAIPIPEGIERVVLLGDGDSEPYETRLALERFAARHRHLDVRVAMAPPGQDLNDVLRGAA